jgi:hypothetical protein
MSLFSSFCFFPQRRQQRLPLHLILRFDLQLLELCPFSLHADCTLPLLIGHKRVVPHNIVKARSQA